jgi:HAE1 family hydrophobic/amphiphilic exporter-1
MIPVAMGGGEGADVYAPLGRAVIGGTITSTLLSLLVIPTFYEVMDGAKEPSAWVSAPAAPESRELQHAGD